MTDQTPTPDPSEPAGDAPKFDFSKAFAALTASGDSVAGTKVEPSAQHRSTARDVAQQFTAYLDEGFPRHEAIYLATLAMQTMFRTVAEDQLRRDRGDQ